MVMVIFIFTFKFELWEASQKIKSIMYRLNSEDLFEVFPVLRYFIFNLFIWKHTPRNAEKCWNFFENSRIFMIFSTFSRFFIEKLLSTVRHKHVIFIIGFAIKFHIELLICGCWAPLSKNGFKGKTDQKWDFTGVEIA